MNTKDLLVDVALKLFSEYGYENVGVSSIVEDVGVKKPTLYHYFGSKKGLLEYIVDYYMDSFLCDLEKISYNGDIVKNLEDLAKCYIDYALKVPVFYNFLKSAIYSAKSSEVYEVLNKKIEAQNIILYNFFNKAALHHTNLKGKSELLLLSFNGIIHSYISFIQKNKDLKVDVHIICKQFMYGIFA